MPERNALAPLLTKLLHGLHGNATIEAMQRVLAPHGLDVRDLRVEVADELEALRREAAEARALRQQNARLRLAVPTGWRAFEALALARGYASKTAMARAVGLSVETVREFQVQDSVPAPTMTAMARAPMAPPPRKYSPGSNPENLDALERRHPELHRLFAKEALRRIGEGSNRLIPRAVVEALRERGEFKGNVHIADRLALRFVIDHPEHAERFRPVATPNR